MFSECIVLPHSKEPKLGSSDQEAFRSADKSIEVALVPCLHMKVSSCSYFRWYGYVLVSWVPFVTIDEFSVRVTKMTSRIGVS